MLRGNCRRRVAAGLLALGLALSAPLPAEARVLERTAITSEDRSELALWERVWMILSSTWERASVLIDPNG